jgi:Xaa-Pro aminopeptidase
LNFYELYRNFSAYQTFIWAHDITLYAYGTDLSVESILSKWSSKITGCVCQTEWHKNLFLSSFPQLKNKINIINNGINSNMFNSTNNIKAKKITNRFIYTSCSERGLYKLTQLWSNILEHLPDAELVISSYNNFPKSDEDNKIQEIINKTPSIKHMGKLNRNELYNLMTSAEYWLYPSYFQETSCITSLELLASEVICLYYPVAGLVNTVGNYGLQISEGNELEMLLSLSNKRKIDLKKKGKEYALSCSWQNRATEWSELLKLNSSFEYKIKIINLKERTDRKKYMTEQFSKNDVTNYEFFEAINGKNIKESEEIDLIQQACDITEKGFRRALQFVKPSVMEYEIEAEFAHEFIRNRSKGFAYTPIIASGNNANVLHYIENNQQCHAGDLILLDVAAEYANYSSDMTRMIPVSGRFTERQKAVYKAVLNVKNEATKMLTPGTLWKQYHVEVGKIMTSELLHLGLIDTADVQNENPDWPAYKKYFMHGTSHFLGLDVHDVGNKYQPFAEGMVFTCEPGIYIPEEGLGIRLENNILITKNGPEDLMKNIPIEVDEIEALMLKK